MQILCKKRLLVVFLSMYGIEIFGSQQLQQWQAEDCSLSSPQKVEQAQEEEDSFFKMLDDACAEVNRWVDPAQRTVLAYEFQPEQGDKRLARQRLQQRHEMQACVAFQQQREAQKEFVAFQQAWVDQGALEFDKILAKKHFTKEEEQTSQALCGAAFDGNEVIVRKIVQGPHGSRVINSPYMNSTTNPLLAAAGNGHLSIVLFLIAHGADTSYRNGRGAAFLDVARSNIVEHFKK